MMNISLTEWSNPSLLPWSRSSSQHTHIWISHFSRLAWRMRRAMERFHWRTTLRVLEPTCPAHSSSKKYQVWRPNSKRLKKKSRELKRCAHTFARECRLVFASNLISSSTQSELEIHQRIYCVPWGGVQVRHIGHSMEAPYKKQPVRG